MNDVESKVFRLWQDGMNGNAISAIVGLSPTAIGLILRRLLNPPKPGGHAERKRAAAAARTAEKVRRIREKWQGRTGSHAH